MPYSIAANRAALILCQSMQTTATAILHRSLHLACRYWIPTGSDGVCPRSSAVREIGSPLEVSCFSFTRHLLGVGPPFEKLRMARVMGPGSGPAGHKKTPAAATAEKLKAAAAKKVRVCR